MFFTGGKLRETPLHIAARVKDGDRCALMLLKSGAGPNLAMDDGQTPVHVAAQYGNLITLQLLLDDGGDPLFKNKVSYCTHDQCKKNLHHSKLQKNKINIYLAEIVFL